jgi:4-hydroxy-tetrahydrodipicolinate synthase
VACLERLAAESLDAGAAGIVALGTTGEASALDDAERSQVVAACAGLRRRGRAPARAQHRERMIAP